MVSFDDSNTHPSTENIMITIAAIKRPHFLSKIPMYWWFVVQA